MSLLFICLRCTIFFIIIIFRFVPRSRKFNPRLLENIFFKKKSPNNPFNFPSSKCPLSIYRKIIFYLFLDFYVGILEGLDFVDLSLSLFFTISKKISHFPSTMGSPVSAWCYLPQQLINLPTYRRGPFSVLLGLSRS